MFQQSIPWNKSRINRDKKIEDLVNNEEFKNEIRKPITLHDFDAVLRRVTCRGMGLQRELEAFNNIL